MIDSSAISSWFGLHVQDEACKDERGGFVAGMEANYANTGLKQFETGRWQLQRLQAVPASPSAWSVSFSPQLRPSNTRDRQDGKALIDNPCCVVRLIL
ncbi:MAG: hypothetical protein RLZZ245_3257 [Verrucomicrobiota bacterium]|jgi:hypothetical protein